MELRALQMFVETVITKYGENRPLTAGDLRDMITAATTGLIPAEFKLNGEA
jgi:hypothetical protein